MLGPQPAVLYWGWSSTSKRTCDKSNKTNLEASAHVKYIKREIKGNDQVCSFSPDKKHFLVPSLKSNTPSELLSYRALCNLGLLVPTTLVLLLTGLFVEGNKFGLQISSQCYTHREAGVCAPFRDQNRLEPEPAGCTVQHVECQFPTCFVWILETPQKVKRLISPF